MDLKTLTGKKIKELRMRHGLTQVQLASACGVSEPTIIRIEKGTAATNLDLLESLCKQLDVEAWALLTPSPAAGPLDPILADLMSIWAKLDDVGRREILFAAQGVLRLSESRKKSAHQKPNSG